MVIPSIVWLRVKLKEYRNKRVWTPVWPHGAGPFSLSGHQLRLFICWIVTPSKFKCLVPNPVPFNVPVLRDTVFKEIIKSKWGHSVALIQSRCPCNKRKLRHRHTREDLVKTWSNQPPALPTPWSWTSRLQNHEKTNCSFLSHPVYGTSLWKP